LRVIERIWQGNDALARAGRAALAPFEGAYRAIITTRGWMYDHSLLRVHSSTVPVVSIGNLSVGGTGKTPFTAWLAGELASRGSHPSIVLRGYGDDEPLVHARLNPEIPVIVEPRRADGIARAAKLGATVALLDDAFQHRAAARDADIVLIAAEQWDQRRRQLPAGPWRESLGALRRASLVVITRKTAVGSRLEQIVATIHKAAPMVPQARIRFSLSYLKPAAGSADDEGLSLSVLSGKPVTAVAGIANSSAFFYQLSDVGAVVTAFPFPDHHHYSAADVKHILGLTRTADAFIVCTLKDAVKLAPIWPATAPPLWYVSQTLEVESGGDALEKLLSQLISTDLTIK
jgi:tetraacyldisaccharide 4'-kinase